MKKAIKRNRRVWAFLLSAALLCAGCGSQQSQDIPELLEPVALNSAYRPVEYGDIGEIKILYGTVVPTDYCHFYSTNVTVSQITVEVGDYVEEGETLAYADVASAQEELSGLQAQLEQENKTYELNKKISDAKIAQLSYLKQKSAEELQAAQNTETDTTPVDEEANDAASTPETNADTATTPADEAANDTATTHETNADTDTTDYDSQISIEQENARYDALLHQYRVDKLNKSIAEKQEIITDGTLKAKHAGYVTYTKNIAYNREAGGTENIVIISDPEDTYIELSSIAVNAYSYEDYELKYIKIAGENLSVTEIPYTSDELILAKAGKKYPYVRLTCPEAGKLTIGDNYPVYFQEKDIRNVLIVGNDSLYTEENSTFVYVQSETGEKEKREITIGASDNNYTEVVSGLTEGELVYYESKARMPAYYDEYIVQLSDFTIKNYACECSMSNTMGFPYSSDYEGTIEEIAVKEEQEIQQGDLLYVINTGEGKAALTEAQTNINRENSSYAETMKNYEEQLAALTTESGDTYTEYELQILNCKKELASISHTASLAQLQKTLATISENNDGTGKISVYARQAGTVEKISVSAGDKVLKGEELLSISAAGSNMILAQMGSSQTREVYTLNIADIGEQVSMTYDGVTYTGTCIGWTVNINNEQKVYLTTDETGTALTYSSSSGYDYPGFFVKMDDEAAYENVRNAVLTFNYISMNDVCVIPSDMIYTETKVESGRSYNYVWRIVDGELVKQYVLTDASYSDTNTMVVLSGIKAGDVLAQEY